MSRYQGNNLFTFEDEAVACEHTVRVAFASAVDNEFNYLMPTELWPIAVGQRVEVPFGKNNKLQTGFCVGIEDNTDIQKYQKQGREKRRFKLKRVSRVIDKKPLIDADLMALAKWISSYYICPLGQVLAAMVPAAVKKGIGTKRQKYIYLAEGSNEKIEQLRGKKQKQIIAVLYEKKALNSDSALESQSLLEIAGCANLSIKRLAEKRIVKIVQKTVFKALPVIPDSITVKPTEVILNDDQQKALVRINRQIETEKFGVTLLYGVTDSGKTELYIRAIEAGLQKGRSAIVLLPEIALTAQTVQRFSLRFKKVAVMHSGLTAAQRNVQWQKIKAGEADVVVGARSAVFAPLTRIGLIVVDEEHEPSYKQDTVPRYSGRDVAIKRAQLSGAHCILGSATPSLETVSNCRNRKHFNMVRLPRRVMGLPNPKMKLVDLRDGVSTRKANNLISEPLTERLREVLAKKEQAILLLNRRGYSNFIFCPSCGYTLHCRNCDITLTFHKSGGPGNKRMQTVTGKHMNYGCAMCHYCGSQTLVPEKCSICGKGMAMIGLGSQRLEEELIGKFPDARVSRIDSDSMASKDYYHFLKDFGEGRIDILAGTQMLAKGLHFPNVTLVGIISADTCLYLPDFRANERTFQLISQVAGRAGRSKKKGVVFVQTFMPNQPAIQFALQGDYDGFIGEELKHRRSCKLPPFWRLAAVIMRDRNFDKLNMACQAMCERIGRIVEQDSLKVIVRGPMPAVIDRIQRFHRMQIIIQSLNAETMHRLFTILRSAGSVRPVVKTVIDIDPVNLL